MTEPITEQIMAAVKTRVAAAFTANRSTRVATWQVDDQATNVYQGNLTPNVNFSCPGNPPAQGWTLEVIVAGIAKPSDFDTTAIDTHKNRLAADIMDSITDSATWHNWGGLAINTDIGPVEDYTGTDAAFQGVMIRLNIYFRTSELSMYTSRS
jgi:hypothetical protein